MNHHILIILFLNSISPGQTNTSKHYDAIGYINKQLKLTGNIDPAILHEAFLDPIQKLNLYGYPGETHIVNTSDGYNLNVHRIPHKNPYAKPILLMHGLTGASSQFFLQRNNSPAFILADAGYDIWMGNFRGNIFTSHNKYDKTNKLFWRFSMDESAEIDLPFTIDYILNYTNQTKLTLAGHSLGTTISFAMFSNHTSYNNKVNCFLALSPITSLNYYPNFVYSIMLSILPEVNNVDFHVNYFNGQTLTTILEICSSKDYFYLCEYMFGFLIGYDPYLYNTTRITDYLASSRFGASLKVYLHFTQLTKKNGFRKFDYGKTMNMEVYNSILPPIYNLTQVTVPVIFFYGANDIVADPLDVELLSRQLPNLKGKELFPWPLCSHLDMMYAKNLKQLMFDKLISYIKLFE